MALLVEKRFYTKYVVVVQCQRGGLTCARSRVRPPPRTMKIPLESQNSVIEKICSKPSRLLSISFCFSFYTNPSHTNHFRLRYIDHQAMCKEKKSVSQAANAKQVCPPVPCPHQDILVLPGDPPFSVELLLPPAPVPPLPVPAAPLRQPHRRLHLLIPRRTGGIPLCQGQLFLLC